MIIPGTGIPLSLNSPKGLRRGRDLSKLLAVFRDEWTLQHAIRNNEDLELRAVAPEGPPK